MNKAFGSVDSGSKCTSVHENRYRLDRRLYSPESEAKTNKKKAPGVTPGTLPNLYKLTTLHCVLIGLCSYMRHSCMILVVHYEP